MVLRRVISKGGLFQHDVALLHRWTPAFDGKVGCGLRLANTTVRTECLQLRGSTGSQCSGNAQARKSRM